MKEFVWDIIGYLIPGYLVIILFNFFITSNIGVKNDFLFSWELLNPAYVLIVLAYVLGFIVYGLTQFKICIQDLVIEKTKKFKISKFLQKYHSEIWKDEFENSQALIAAKRRLTDDGISEASQMKVNEIRDIFMSRNPEMDQKIYTFMFRASVFDHTSTILMIFAVIALIGSFLQLFGLHFFKYESVHIILYISFPFLCIRLGNAKRYFYSISQRIPMSNLK
ncbi:hypothetical protein ACFS7Y_21400 [Sphingobacterium bambusae]|uniref:DUF4239 domain-containing protein n=1 Tax=Sphingobacterium bambusae TaxID=662858 RepID=A0ABW6BKC3_9SPHI